MTTKRNPFKTGDKVRCIDDSNTDDLVKDKIYLVHEIAPGRAGEPMVVIAYDSPDAWYAKRFELVSEG